MKEKEKIINCGGKEYKLVFNLNVMQEIQNEYGTLEKWGDLTDGFVYDENGEKIPMRDKNNQVITKSVNDANGNITQKVVYKTKEINIKALIFGIRLMINEAIDIENETAEIKKAYLNDKQVGRIVTEIGIYNATSELNQVVIDSTKSDNQKKRVIHEKDKNEKIDFSWFSFVGVTKLHFTEKEVFRMTLRKFNKLWQWYKVYHDLEKSNSYREIEKKQEKDDEWFN